MWAATVRGMSESWMSDARARRGHVGCWGGEGDGDGDGEGRGGGGGVIVVGLGSEMGTEDGDGDGTDGGEEGEGDGGDGEGEGEEEGGWESLRKRSTSCGQWCDECCCNAEMCRESVRRREKGGSLVKVTHNVVRRDCK